MTDADAKLAIINKRWRVWYNDSRFSIDKWIVQRRNWYGGWTTVGKFWSNREALEAKKLLMQQDLETFRGNLSEL